MVDAIVPYEGPNAQLNVTFGGGNGDYPDPVNFDVTDGDIKQVAMEAIRDGYIPGISADPNVDLTDFVVDRFPATEELPPRLMLRPKTPFGMKLDGKFHGVIVKNKDGSVVPQDQWMCFLAKDNAVPSMLDGYLASCEALGAGARQLESVRDMIDRVDKWRRENPDLCKTPDTDQGEIQ